jgi:hypothetical protein
VVAAVEIEAQAAVLAAIGAALLEKAAAQTQPLKRSSPR